MVTPCLTDPLSSWRELVAIEAGDRPRMQSSDVDGGKLLSTAARGKVDFI